MGLVRRGHEAYLDRSVAVKVPGLSGNAAKKESQFKQRFST